MHIKEIFKLYKTTISFEFFPPKSAKASEALYRTINDLIPIQPSYVSVTYGAGGSTRELTHDLVVHIQKETDLTVVSHLTCVGATKEEILEILKKYHASGIRNIMALRGDPPKGQTVFESLPGGFEYATELVAFIKKHFPDMGIGVAGFPDGHPATLNRLEEIDFLKKKVDAGADFICTQLFFDNHDFYDFRARCELGGIGIPIIAGLMPITSFKNINSMADLAARVRFPARLLKALRRCETDAQVEQAGIHWAAEQVRDLLDHEVRGIHFYTLNKSTQIKKICDSLGLTHTPQFNK
ncbi:MAG: methylenetetrahydrofolate reductase [NAD(P)H] [Desulfobacteraceae bacterium]|nr:MAG: methylenetetrahydrofolate reductase [NAD(P)H] [Desulfobacteraceae bacterium]